MQRPVYPYIGVSRCMAHPGPSRPLQAILPRLAGRLCRILQMNFREFLFHALG